jgi:hypothetical protein
MLEILCHACPESGLRLQFTGSLNRPFPAQKISRVTVAHMSEDAEVSRYGDPR